MKRNRKRFRTVIVMMMVLVMTGGLFLQNGIRAKADGDVTAADYTADENGNMAFHADSENTYDNVAVPEGYIFEVTAATTVTGTFTIADGGNIFILDNPDAGSAGSLTVTTWNASQGASVMFGNSSIPAGMELYDGDTHITSMTDEYMWQNWVYDGDGKWVQDTRPLGQSAIIDDSAKYIYAYGTDDADTAKSHLARELYCRFIRVWMYGSFGLPNEGWDGPSEANISEGAGQLLDRIERLTDGDGTITAKKNNGDDVNINYSTFRVNWGYDEENPEQEVTSFLRVYYSNDIGDDGVLVNTDYSHNAGNGTTSESGHWYLRNLNNDKLPFAEGDADGCLIKDDSYGNVVVGGNACLSSSVNTDGLFTVELSTRESYFNAAYGEYSNTYNGFIRVLKPGAPYLEITGDGENKKFGPLGVNDANSDTIWRAGADTIATTYIGYSSVYIDTLSNIGEGLTITDVELADSSLADGVTIEAEGDGRFKLSFASNFYDLIPLTITYSNGQSYSLTLQRIGLVFRYLYLSGNHGIINCSCNDSEADFTCDYDGGEQIVVFATYYHPSNDVTASGGGDLYLSINYDDGNSEIIYHQDGDHDFNGYKESAHGGVATTSFIIGFLPSHYDDGSDIREQTFRNKFGNRGGMSATVINAGFDDPDSYSGTQIGSGQGVYWNGEVSWASNN